MNTDTDINLTNIFFIIRKRIKAISLFVLAVTIAAVITCFILPKQYYATTTAIPVNAQLTDKARIFNNNIQSLYSVYGNDDDLDRLYTTAKTRDVLLFVIDSLQLVKHYEITTDQPKANEDALALLKKNIVITKTENGTLKIEAWDKDALVAEALAGCIMQRTEAQTTAMMQQSNENIMDKLSNAIAIKKARYQNWNDSLGRLPLPINSLEKLAVQINDEEKILDEFSIAVKVKQPSLMMLEKPYHSLKPDKPKTVFIIAAAVLLSLFFAIFLVLILESIQARNDR